jgi:type IV pilus assembly protein PilW
MSHSHTRYRHGHSLSRGSRQRGLSLVELMVGVAVGLFVVAGAAKVTVDSVVSNRRLLMEARVNQDMRAAADVIARDLRRASYWENSLSGLWSTGSSVVSATNPYWQIDASAANNTTGSIVYSYQRPNAADRNLGFRLVVDSGVGHIEIQDATGGWQTITDPASINVSSFTIAETSKAIELWTFCSCRTRVPPITGCDDATLSTSANRPQMVMRDYVMQIRASSATDPAVQRELRETVRVRNDALRNPMGCPGAGT